MSVLIKGMKIPENCFMCPESYQYLYSENFLKWFCRITGKDISCGLEKDTACPLIELPPHGRLIDADALENKEYNLIRYVYRDGYTAVQQVALSAVPTILEAEVE